MDEAAGKCLWTRPSRSVSAPAFAADPPLTMMGWTERAKVPRRVGAHSESEMQFLLPTGKASENQRNQAGFHAPSLWAAASAAMGCALKFSPSLSQKYDLKGKKRKKDTRIKSGRCSPWQVVTVLTRAP